MQRSIPTSSRRHFPTRSTSVRFMRPRTTVVSASRAAILDGTGIEPIVRTIDNCQRNHNLGTVFEVRTGGGSLLVCTANIDSETNSLPCRQLMASLLDYASSEDFKPEQTVETDVLDAVFA